MGGSTGRAAEAGTVTGVWAHALVDQLLILCGDGPNPPAQPEFAAWMERLARHDFRFLLVHANGAEPTPAQRKELAEFWRGRPTMRVAMLTDSLSSRAVLTAITWLLRDHHIRAFAGDEYAASLVWLGCSTRPEHVAAAVAGLRAMIRMATPSGPGTDRRAGGASFRK